MGTLGALFDRFVQKTEEKRDKATVFLTVAFSMKAVAKRHVHHRRTWDDRLEVDRHDAIRNDVASLERPRRLSMTQRG